jgi:Spy/CpxP family protein refolding chaperone
MKLLALAAASLLATATLGAAPAQAGMHHHGWHMKRVCHTTWVHHHKVTRCHNERVRW